MNTQIESLWMASAFLRSSRFNRLCWIAKEYVKLYDDMTETAVYKHVDSLTRGY